MSYFVISISHLSIFFFNDWKIFWDFFLSGPTCQKWNFFFLSKVDSPNILRGFKFYVADLWENKVFGAVKDFWKEIDTEEIEAIFIFVSLSFKTDYSPFSKMIRCVTFQTPHFSFEEIVSSETKDWQKSLFLMKKRPVSICVQ